MDVFGTIIVVNTPNTIIHGCSHKINNIFFIIKREARFNIPEPIRGMFHQQCYDLGLLLSSRFFIVRFVYILTIRRFRKFMSFFFLIFNIILNGFFLIRLNKILFKKLFLFFFWNINLFTRSLLLHLSSGLRSNTSVNFSLFNILFHIS